MNLRKITFTFTVKVIFRLKQTSIKFGLFVTTNVPHNSKHFDCLLNWNYSKLIKTYVLSNRNHTKIRN